MNPHKCAKSHCACNEVSTLSSTKREPFSYLKRRSPKSLIWKYKT